jgi:ceramide glucosyltransferase
MTIASTALILCIFIMFMNILSLVIMGDACKARPRTKSVPLVPVPVSIVRPLKGIENFSYETLSSLFCLDYPSYEIIFCVQSESDPIIPIVEGFIAAYPRRNAKLLIGDNRVSINPKLNNCVKGWEASQSEYIILSDSNVLAPPDYIQTMLDAFCDDTALTISMPIGSRPDSFWAIVECAILNTFQARWQYGADAIGIGFAQGKNMMWRREVLDRVGGIRALGSEVAEDAAATKIVRSQNMRIRLVDMPFQQPLGVRSFNEVYSRHARWARLRRATFPWHYAPEFMNGSFVAVLSGAYAAYANEVDPIAISLSVLFILYAGEILLAKRCGFYLGPLMPVALFVRDLILPIMFIDGLIIDNFVWHGEEMSVKEENNVMGVG